MARYCSYLLPKHDGGTCQIQVNRRFYPWFWQPDGSPCRNRIDTQPLSAIRPAYKSRHCFQQGVISGAMLLIEEDPRIEPDTLWKELIVSATVRQSKHLSLLTCCCCNNIVASEVLLEVVGKDDGKSTRKRSETSSSQSLAHFAPKSSLVHLSLLSKSPRSAPGSTLPHAVAVCLLL